MTRERTDDVAVEDQPRGDTFATEAHGDEEAAREQWREYGEDELTILVRDNADKEVICSWMDNAVVTLSVAMNNYDWPPYITLADEPFLITVVNGLLANRPIKPEEPKKEEIEAEKLLVESEDEKRPPEEKPARTEEPTCKTKPEIRKSQIKPETAVAAPPPDKIIATPQDLEIPIREEEKLPEHKNQITQAAVEAVAKSAHDEPTPPIQNPVASEPVIHVPKSTVETINTDNLPITETLPIVTNNTLETVEERVVINEIEISAGRQQPEALKMTETAPTVLSATKESPVLIEPQRMTGSKPEPAWLPATRELEPAELTVETVEVDEDQPALAALDYQIDPSGLADFDEKDVLISHHEEVDRPILETIEYGADIEKIMTLQTDDELPVAGQEVVDLEPQVQAGVTFEEIENSLVQLAERIKQSDPPVSEMANENLDKIIETVAILETLDRENIIIEAEVQGELEELFTELFDTLGIAYTPELIKHLSHQALEWRHLVDEIEKLQKEEAAEEISQDSGTHFTIKKLIAALKTIKRVTGHAGAIGKAALVLCFNFQPKFNESF